MKRRSFLAAPLALVAGSVAKEGVDGATVKEVPTKDSILVIEVPGRLSREAHQNIRRSVEESFKQSGYDRIPVLVATEGMRIRSVPMTSEFLSANEIRQMEDAQPEKIHLTVYGWRGTANAPEELKGQWI